jgi:transmembrane protein EpsG
MNLDTVESIFFYLICISLSVGCIFYSNVVANNWAKKILTVVGLSVPVLVSTFRYNVGVDYPVYELLYQGYIAGDAAEWLDIDRIEPAMGVLAHLSNFLFSSSLLYFGIPSLLSVCIFYIALKKFNPNRLWAVWLTYLLYLYPVVTLGLVRQGVAISLCFLAMYYLYAKKPIYYTSLVIVAATFHYTALVFLPLYFINRLVDSQKYIALVCIGSFLVALMLAGSVVGANALYQIVQDVALPSVIENYIDFSAERTVAFQPRIKFIITLALIFPAIWYLVIRRIDLSPDTRKVKFIFALAMLALAVSTTSFYTTSVDRLANYLLPFLLILITYYDELVIPKWLVRIWLGSVVSFFLMWFVFNLSAYSDERRDFSQLNYQTIWSKND